MITLRITKSNFVINTFFIKKNTPIANALNSFGYIRYIDKKGVIIADWYDNFTKVELKFKLDELKENYKSVYPYFNTKFVRGNIWKYSYGALISKICKDRGFSHIKVDKMTFKKTPIKGNNVIISDAVYVLNNKITKLQGRIAYISKNSYTIVTEEGTWVMGRCSFTLLPQDYFILLSVRC